MTGKGVEERVQKNGIDLKIFSLKPLNFLEVVLPFQGFLYMMVESIKFQVSHAGLSSLPGEVVNLTNLTSLVLKGNQVKYE